VLVLQRPHRGRQPAASGPPPGSWRVLPLCRSARQTQATNRAEDPSRTAGAVVETAAVSGRTKSVPSSTKAACAGRVMPDPALAIVHILQSRRPPIPVSASWRVFSLQTQLHAIRGGSRGRRRRRSVLRFGARCGAPSTGDTASPRRFEQQTRARIADSVRRSVCPRAGSRFMWPLFSPRVCGFGPLFWPYCVSPTAALQMVSIRARTLSAVRRASHDQLLERARSSMTLSGRPPKNSCKRSSFSTWNIVSASSTASGVT
jgi:hypothetical protein